MMDEILDVLTECAEFLDRYADYESDGYGGMEPNSALRLLHDVQRMIDRVEETHPPPPPPKWPR